MKGTIKQEKFQKNNYNKTKSIIVTVSKMKTQHLKRLLTLDGSGVPEPSVFQEKLFRTRPRVSHKCVLLQWDLD